MGQNRIAAIAQEKREAGTVDESPESVEINVHKYYSRSMNYGTFKWYKKKIQQEISLQIKQGTLLSRNTLIERYN